MNLVFTPGTYTVTFNANGGGTPSMASKSVTYGSTYGTLATCSRAGYRFEGWYTSASGGTKIESGTNVAITAAQTLYAHWSVITYSITILGGTGGSATPSTYQVSTSDQTVALTRPTQKGSNFSSWSSNRGEVNDDTLTIPAGTTGDITVSAIFTAVEYTLTFDKIHGTGGTDFLKLKYLDYLEEITIPSRYGYDFQGYFYGTTQYYDKNGSPVGLHQYTWDYDVSFNARWDLGEYSITVDPNGGSGGSARPSKYTYAGGNKYIDLTRPTRTGYDFSYWSSNKGTLSGSNTLVLSGTDAGEVTVTAHWTAKNYSVTIAPNGGTGGSASPATYQISSSARTVALTRPTRAGYSFLSWTTTKGEVDDDTLTIPANTTGDITVTANWTANSYTVTFNANGGGTPSPATKSVTYASTYGTLATCSRTGYTLAGWYTSASGGTKVESGTKVAITAAQTLYAHWTANSYTVTFNGNGGGTPSPATKSVTYDSTYGTLATCSRGGYTLAGWYTSASGGTKVESGTKVAITAAQTLYAHWTANTYSITVAPNGGTGGSASPATYQISTTAQTVALTRPTRAGYSFSSWTTTKGTVSGDTLTIPANAYGNITLTANWAANSYTVTFNANGGGTPSPASKSVTYDSTYGTLATCSRGGYTFAGWYTAASGGTKIESGTKVAITAAQTLYAHWTANTYSVKVDPNGWIGGSASPSTYQINETAAQTVALTRPPRAGYLMTWTTTKGEVVGDTLTIPAGEYGNIVVTANWTAIDYEVAVDPNGGEGGAATPSSYHISASRQNIILTRPTLAGHALKSWQASIGTVSGDTLTIPENATGDIVVKANWEIETYSVTVNRNGGSGGDADPDAYQISDSAQTVALTRPTRAGYSFSSWATTKGEVNDDTLTIPANTTGNITVTAVWTAITYAITVAQGGGSGGSASPATYQISPSAQTVTLTRPTRAGHVFDSWETTKGTLSGNVLTIPADTHENITVTASFRPIDYRVSLERNGGTGGLASPAVYNISTSSQTVALTPPVKPGYSLSWSVSKSECTVSGNTLTIPANTTGDITVTANWTANSYTVTFNANGGGTPSMASKSVTYDSAYGTLATCSRGGYTFAGWYTAASGGTKIESGTTVAITAAQTLYAHWTAIKYSITVSPNGGTGGSSNPAAYSISTSAQTVALTRPTRAGYSLSSWTTTKGTVSGDTLTIPANTTGDITVTANWTVATYTISVDPFGGSGGSVSPATYQMSSSDQTFALVVPNPPAGKTFVKWSASRGTATRSSLRLAAGTSGDVYVTAVWSSGEDYSEGPSSSRFVTTLARKGEHNDIGLRNRDFAFAEGKAAYAAILEAAVLTVKGELIYNVEEGIPYFDTAFESPIYLKVWAENVKDRIWKFEFVEDIESFEYEYDADAGKVSYTARVRTDEGEVEISG